jgi:hypothetical protein
VAMLGHLLLKVGYKVVVSVEELGVFINMFGCLMNFVKVLFIYTVVLDKRLIFRLVDSHLDNGVGQLWKLDSFLQETDSSLLEGDSSDSFIFDGFDLNFSSSHLVVKWGFRFVLNINYISKFKGIKYQYNINYHLIGVEQ